MFADLLRLTTISESEFEAPASPDKGARMFGGQFLAQSLWAAYQSVTNDRDIHSLHAYFLRPGDVDEALRLHVESVRDGRGFSSRQVVAKQFEKELFRMMASFQTPAQTPEYAGVTMPEVPPPEEVSYTYDDFNEHVTGEATWAGMDRPMDILYVNPPLTRGRSVSEPQLMWMKIRDALPAHAGAHRAGLAYLSDSALVDHVMLPHGRYWQDADFAGASLDHAMWFHRHAPADDWLLFAQNAEATGSGRGLARGHFFSRDGQLIATCVQEGLMRWLDT